MLLYKDVISGDEIISDAYDITEVDDMVYEVNCRSMMGLFYFWFLVSPGADFDIGANASAEEQAEDLADDAVQIIDVVHSMRLAATEFDKKTYITYIKGKQEQNFWWTKIYTCSKT